MEQNLKSALVDPVAVISMIKRELRAASVSGESLSPMFVESCALRLEQAEQWLEQQPARIARKIAQLVEQELVRDMMG